MPQGSCQVGDQNFCDRGHARWGTGDHPPPPVGAIFRFCLGVLMGTLKHIIPDGEQFPDGLYDFALKEGRFCNETPSFSNFCWHKPSVSKFNHWNPEIFYPLRAEKILLLWSWWNPSPRSGFQLPSYPIKQILAPPLCCYDSHHGETSHQFHLLVIILMYSVYVDLTRIWYEELIF